MVISHRIASSRPIRTVRTHRTMRSGRPAWGPIVTIPDQDAADQDAAAALLPHLGPGTLVAGDEAACGAGLVLLLTEWKQYLGLDPAALKEIVANPRILVGRNASTLPVGVMWPGRIALRSGAEHVGCRDWWRLASTLMSSRLLSTTAVCR